MNKSEEKKELKVKFLDYYSALPIQKLAAGYIGKDETTICRWKDEDPEFANQISEAASAWAKSKAAGVKSKEWLLERVMNDHFGQKTKTDITSGGEKLEALTILAEKPNESDPTKSVAE